MDESVYQFKPTEQFSEKFKAIKSAGPSGYKRISKMIERLLLNPDDADGKMHGLYNGRLKKICGSQWLSNYLLLVRTVPERKP
jgi:hypothetical protein